MTLEQTLPLLTDLVNLKELILIWLHLYIYVYTHGTKIKAYENFISNIYWKINFLVISLCPRNFRRRRKGQYNTVAL